MPRSFLIQSTAKPKSNLPSIIVGPRLSICQLCAAPLPITSSTAFMSRPAFWPKAIASDRPCTSPAIAIWLTILASWPEPLGPSSVIALANAIASGLASANAFSSPPHMTVSAPLMAPRLPPETGASMNVDPFFCASAASSRATSAEAVVWSTKIVPDVMPAKAPSAPSVTERRSSSLPTQQNTISAPRAASAGVAPLLPPCLATHAADFGRGAVVDRDAMAGRGEVARHWVAHDAQAEEGDVARGDPVVGLGGHGVSGEVRKENGPEGPS